MQTRQWLFGNAEGILGMGGKDRELQRTKKKKELADEIGSIGRREISFRIRDKREQNKVNQNPTTTIVFNISSPPHLKKACIGSE